MRAQGNAADFRIVEPPVGFSHRKTSFRDQSFRVNNHFAIKQVSVFDGFNIPVATFVCQRIQETISRREEAELANILKGKLYDM